MNDEPYNPLNKLSLARSIESEILKRKGYSLAGLESLGIKGAGVYVIYYLGAFPEYESIRNTPSDLYKPIYVGKAIPKGGRKGGLTENASAVGTALRDRLKDHANSIRQCRNLEVKDFYFRYLQVDDIWIPLGENVLIETFKPVWNRAIDGFGNKVPGRRRRTQFKSPWDVLHPGRKVAKGLGDSGMTAKFLKRRVADYFAGRPLAKLPKKIVEQQEKITSEAKEIVDES